MIGPVHPGPKVFGRRDPRQFPELAGAGRIEAGRSRHENRRGQSFFDPLPAGADLYLLKSILNDWPGEPTVAILRRCAEAAQVTRATQATTQPMPAIAILGGVSADETPRSLGIDMLVAGGRTSTLTQFTELARQAGLEVVVARTQASGRFVVECRLPTQPQAHDAPDTAAGP